MKQTKPNWFRQKIHSTPESKHVRALLSSLNLNTVCSEAACPNRNRCYADGTATFLILGRNCTRNCRFCNIAGGTPELVDPGEPERVALAAKGMELSHVVITSVTRDDLLDGGANHFAETVRWIRDLLPEASIELLVPDFGGSERSLRIVLDSGPDVLNHNVETVPGLYQEVRPGADYRRSLDLLEISSNDGFVTKSGIMLGFGESADQVMETFADLAGAGIDILTVGQYLPPSPTHYPVKRYVSPEEFDLLSVKASNLGIARVVAGPLVRSSFRAGETYKSLIKQWQDVERGVFVAKKGED
jgi:lipoic acid synthetase